jgi:hypothetical protein
LLDCLLLWLMQIHLLWVHMKLDPISWWSLYMVKEREKKSVVVLHHISVYAVYMIQQKVNTAFAAVFMPSVHTFFLYFSVCLCNCRAYWCIKYAL